MNHRQAFFIAVVVGLFAGNCGASAQTFEQGTKQVSGQSTVDERPSAISRVKVWTRARWEAARKHWSQDNAKFYACSHTWRQRMGGRKYSLHDQRDFLFHCMNDMSATQVGEPSVIARASTWTREHGQQEGCSGLANMGNSMSAATNYSKSRAFDGSPGMMEEIGFSDA